ncbi:MAG: aldehyde dehydrogenase family protein [Planctomycetaceae bacterium]|nr:aldehyde dehydrogenase family protein [Planctomycetaceae bacterium]
MKAINPATGEAFGAEFARSSRAELEAMAEAALGAVEWLADARGEVVAGFLDDCVARLDGDRAGIAQVAHEETALPLSPRLSEVEFNRMCLQMREAAKCLRDESWREVARDAANNLRAELAPLGGAVLAIGPSNFPLAFNGVSGGDFCAAIAARNPVIAKAHPGHPNTTARIFGHIAAARDAAGLPAAAVQLFYDCAPEDGLALLAHRGVAALGFTGSRASGLALKAACDALGKPASLEMASVNPVFVASGAAATRAEAVADAWSASLLLGGGQFCTKPGVIVVAGRETAERVANRAAEVLRAAAPAVLLTEATRAHLSRAVAAMRGAGLRMACGGEARGPGFRHDATLFVASGAEARRHRELVLAEAFGPLGVVVVVESDAELVEFARALDGQLASTVVADPSDDAARRALFAVLRFKAGRLLAEAMPTGVVVSPAMVHGGPFPATGDARFTAVGLPAAARRFSKALCWDRV